MERKRNGDSFPLKQRYPSSYGVLTVLVSFMEEAKKLTEGSVSRHSIGDCGRQVKLSTGDYCSTEREREREIEREQTNRLRHAKVTNSVGHP